MRALRVGSGSLMAACLVLLSTCKSNRIVDGSLRVASVTVAPAAAALLVGDTVRLVATVKDSGDQVLTDRVVTWTSSNPSVATVSATGLVTGMSANAATITATSENVSGTAALTVTARTHYASVAAGTYHSCGLTTDGAAYCWGDNGVAELGDGTATGSPTPVAVTGGRTFALVSTGENSSCGLIADGSAYCWGADIGGELGAGAPGPETCTDPGGAIYPCSHHPLAVAGGVHYTTISSNWLQTCGLDVSGAAFCWGSNMFGELGIGADTATLDTCYAGTPCSRTPVAVAGGLKFTAIATGAWHVCGLTAGGAVYCWGDNRFGQLGLGTTAAADQCDSAPFGGDIGPCSRTPVPVGGGLSFTQLSVGTGHTCALVAGEGWYCWGLNHNGQLGNGSVGPDNCYVLGQDNRCSTQPIAVSGAVSFANVFGGRRHSCGVTAAGVAYCWGDNEFGKLGDNTTSNSLTPAAVAGGLTFSSLSPHMYHTCGLTTSGLAYCWGRNSWGELGNGTYTNSSVPVPVAEPSATAVAAWVRSGRTGLGAPAWRPQPESLARSPLQRTRSW